MSVCVRGWWGVDDQVWRRTQKVCGRAQSRKARPLLFIIRIRKLFVKSDLTEDFLNVIQASIVRYLDPH